MNSVAAADAPSVRLQEGREGGRPQERGISRQDHEIVKLTVVVAERRQRDRNGVARTALNGLFDHLERNPWGFSLRPGLLSSSLRRGLPRQPAGELQARQCVQHPKDHRLAAEPVQRFGPLTAHPRPLACSQHHRRHPWLLAGPQGVWPPHVWVVVAHTPLSSRLSSRSPRRGIVDPHTATTRLTVWPAVMSFRGSSIGRTPDFGSGCLEVRALPPEPKGAGQGHAAARGARRLGDYQQSASCWPKLVRVAILSLTEK